MSVYDDVLTAVIDLAEQTELYSKIVIGPMPPENGISIAWGSGNLNTFLDKKSRRLYVGGFKLQKFRSRACSGHAWKTSHVFESAEGLSLRRSLPNHKYRNHGRARIFRTRRKQPMALRLQP